ncbi:MAG: M1 family aminopeptidase [Candidatus Zixiibacteriota bacterium]
MLVQHDLQICLDSGRLAFLEPLVIDSVSHVYGGYFEGSGRLRFNPLLETEKDQLRRFFEADSLDREFKNIFLMFGEDYYNQLVENSRQAGEPFDNDAVECAKEHGELAAGNENARLFAAFQNLLRPTETPFLMLNVSCRYTNRLIYLFDPYVREEIQRWRIYNIGFGRYIENVSSYSQYAKADFTGLNGGDKSRLAIRHYDIDGALNDKGNFSGATRLDMDILAPVQVVRFSLHNMLKVDSVLTTDRERVRFLRYKDSDLWSDWQGGLYLLFDKEYREGDSVSLTVYCEGKIAQQEYGQFFVTAGGWWYPRYPDNPRATFELRMKTPKDYVFVTCGKQVGEDKIKDTFITHWTVADPTVHISFAYGPMKKFEFFNAKIGTVDVYYNEDFHDKLAQEEHEYGSLDLTGKNMEKQVSEDIINAMKLFIQKFGSYPYDRLSVTEILLYHGQAFPGFLHLGLSTWENTDAWGNQRLFRAHEVAHQWWGVGVGVETYHDTWLSEGFAEYSALMYLQLFYGQEKFLEKIKEYRKDIFSVRKYIFGLSGEEAGPIIMGHRTASTKTEDDYDLIIYKKGALVLHMLRNLLLDFRGMNESNFFTMMSEFYLNYYGKNVTTEDFKKMTEKYTGIDMDWFFKQWVYKNDLSTYNFSYECRPDENGRYSAFCRIVTEGVNNEFKMFLPVEIEFSDGNKGYLKFLVDKTDFEITIPNLPEKPRKITLNPFESVLAKVNQ